MKRRLPILPAVLAILIIPALLASSAFAEGPFDRYLAGLRHHAPETRVRAFAAQCVHGSGPAPQITRLYSQGDWYTARNLPVDVANLGGDSLETAEVWNYSGKPRVVYLWEVDLEYEREAMYCLDLEGKVTATESRFYPSSSGEPREHWVYVHRFSPSKPEHAGKLPGSFVSLSGAPIARPEVSSEDKDFIAGERKYDRFSDFDFASTLARH